MKSGKLKSTDANDHLLLFSSFQSFTHRKAEIFLFQFTNLADSFPSSKLTPLYYNFRIKCYQISSSFLDLLELVKTKSEKARFLKWQNSVFSNQVFQNQHFHLSCCPLLINSEPCAAIVADNDLLCMLKHKCSQLLRSSLKKHIPVSSLYNLPSFIPFE